MELVHAIPAVAVLIEWLLAAGLYVADWYRPRPGVSRVGDSLVLAGIVTASMGVAWQAWDVSPELSFARGSLATGLAVAALAVYAVLAGWPGRLTESLSAFSILGFAIPAQAYAAGRLLWKIEGIPQEVFGPLWLTLGVLTGLVGAGALGVGAAMTVLAVVSERTKGRFAVKQPALQEKAVRLALAALSTSLSLDLIRSWWGLGQATSSGFVWSLVAWLLLAASVYGLMQETVPRRLSLALLVPAFAAAIGGMLTMIS